MKPKLEDYTEQEFLDFVTKMFRYESGSEEEQDSWIAHFVTVSEHPGKTDVIFYPEDDEEDSPEGVVQRVKAWRAANGKPGFKQP